MRLIDRYLIQSFFWPFFMTTFLFVSMFILVDSLNSLDEFLTGDTSFVIIAVYYLSMVPVILSQIMPSAVVIAGLYALSTLNKHNEIVALKAAGVSGYKILMPLLYLGLLISFWLLAMNETVTPKSAILSTSIKQGLIKNQGKSLKQRSIPNIAVITSGNRMVYARELVLGTQSLYDVIVLDHRDDLTLKSKTTAQRATFQGDHWIFYNATTYSVNAEGNVTGRPQTVEKLDVDIQESPSEFLRQNTEAQFMSYRQLKEYLRNTRVVGYQTSKRLLIELNKKISDPFICFIMLLVSAPLALKTQRGGAMISIGIGLFVIVAYYSTIAVGLALGKGGMLAPLVAAWAPNLLFFSIGVFLVRKNI